MNKFRINRFLIAAFACAFSSITRAQGPATLPGTYGPVVNYIRTWDPVKPVSNGNDLHVLTEVTTARMSSEYIDGIGRPIEKVAKKGSLVTDPLNAVSSVNAVDMVSAIVYDQFGRERYSYLPFPSNNSGSNSNINNGLFKNNPFPQQQSFYNTYLSSQTGEVTSNTNWAYGKSNFEASPLNRVNESFAPGVSWVGSENLSLPANNRSAKIKYVSNGNPDNVRIWTVAPTTLGTFATYSSSATYVAGELFKTITEDEHGKQVIEFKDKTGLVLLKKVQIGTTKDNGNGTGHGNFLCTYYIYDDFRRLRAVIQPEGVKAAETASWNLTSVLNEQVFRYEFDSKHRMVMKKVPGADVVYMVYDQRDRLVMHQDGLMRTSNKWQVTKYDDLNRPIETGIWINTDPFTSHIGSASSSTSYPATTGTYEELTKTFYDDYQWLAANGNIFSKDRSTDYDAGFLSASNVNFPYPQALTQSFATRGLVTGTKTKVLGTTDQFLYSISYYDEKGRVIQSGSQNITGEKDWVTMQYDFSGKLLRQISATSRNLSDITKEEIVTSYEYDELGRLINIKKTPKRYVNSQWHTGVEKEIVKQEYDELGQLKKKIVGPEYNNGEGLETIVSDYNIRGWLLGMNRDYLTDLGSDNYFGFELGYDKLDNKAGRNFLAGLHTGEFNGNINGMIWKSKGDQVRRKYDFDYDAANRLMKADFEQNTAPSTWGISPINYTVKMGDGVDVNTAYDANGNIKKMQQWGLTFNQSPNIDNLQYTYIAGSNKLLKVYDQVSQDYKLGEFKDGTNGTGNDYAYDVNGNLIQDNNKGISSITYNHLNLPHVITFTGKGTITYVYDANGNKLRKVVQENGATVSSLTTDITSTTNYFGGIIFEGKSYSNTSLSSLNVPDKLQLIGMEEGRIRFRDEDNSFQYDYMLKDHLGNVRMVLTEEQKTIYYPAATLEGTFTTAGTPANSMVNHEKNFYKIDNTKIVDESSIPSWSPLGDPESLANSRLYYNHNGNPPSNLSYPDNATPTQTDGSSKLYKLNANTNKTGLEFLIKVMAGDRIDIFGKSYFLNTGTVNNANSSALDLLSLMNGLIGAPANAIGSKGVTASQMNIWNSSLVPNSFFTGQNGETTTIPKAYINYMFFDDQFKFVGGNSSRVGTSGVVKDHWQNDPNLQNLTAPKNGYIFVYVSNESKLDVFFDNLQVIHKPGPILEETHYYPFGLTMERISSKALAFGSVENRFKFNDGTEFSDKEFNDGSGLTLYETPFRGYDPQIGRFHQMDQLAEISLEWSPFVFASNNPLSRNDRLGLKDSTFKGENPKNKVLSEVVVYSTYTNKDYQKIITDNIHQKLPSLFDLVPFFPTRIRIVGFDPRDFAAGLQAMNNLIDLPQYTYVFVYLNNKLSSGGRLSHGEKKLLWWLRKVERNTGPLSKILGQGILAFQLLADISDFKSGKIGEGRLLYRLGGIATQFAIVGADAGPWGAVAGLIVGMVWGGGEVLYDEVLEPNIVQPLQKWLDGVSLELKSLDNKLKNYMH